MKTSIRNWNGVELDFDQPREKEMLSKNLLDIQNKMQTNCVSMMILKGALPQHNGFFVKKKTNGFVGERARFTI